MLTRALLPHAEVSVILMRRLIPRFLYPGKERVGKVLTGLSAADYAPTFDGVDWYLVPSIVRASQFLRRRRPDIVILEWWTGAVLIPYWWLAMLARIRGARIIIELHEDQDTGEAALPVLAGIGAWGLRRLISLASAFVTHSEWDRRRLSGLLGIDQRLLSVIPHGPYSMAVAVPQESGDYVARSGHGSAGPTSSNAPAYSDAMTALTQNRAIGEAVESPSERLEGYKSTITILFFGTIRPYKGLEYLVDAFDLLPRDTGTVWRLLVVGETWEGWTLPVVKMKASRHRDEIELVNRYVADDEVVAYFARADVVALPYLRSSASGPLHLTMSVGLPVVITRVGGLVEAAEDYSGTVFVSPQDPEALATALIEAAALTTVSHREQHTWADVAEGYKAVFAAVLPPCINS